MIIGVPLAIPVGVLMKPELGVALLSGTEVPQCRHYLWEMLLCPNSKPANNCCQ
jgi:hypothetical protein